MLLHHKYWINNQYTRCVRLFSKLLFPKILFNFICGLSKDYSLKWVIQSKRKTLGLDADEYLLCLEFLSSRVKRQNFQFSKLTSTDVCNDNNRHDSNARIGYCANVVMISVRTVLLFIYFTPRMSQGSFIKIEEGMNSILLTLTTVVILPRYSVLPETQY